AVSHAFRLLASHDPNISGVAAESLRSVVRKKLLRDPTSGECCDFLNGKKDGDFARESGDISTQWSRARHAFQRLSSALRLEWLFVEGTGYHLNIYRSPNPVCVSPSSAGLVVRILRDEMESHFISQLAALVDQGETIQVFSSHPASNHFLQAGDFTRFCDWNYIHRARLGVLQLNATRRFGNRDPRCRKCGYARETIPHVLNHCKPHSVAWRKRHDAIQNRVVRAIPPTVGSVTVNKKFPGISTTLIPDLVLRKKSVGSVTVNKKFPGISITLIPDLVLRKKSGEVYVIDFTVPFEDRPESLSTARQHKIDKYLPIVEHLRREGKSAFVDAVVVGSLGSWDPSNDAVLA
ncbi:c2H2-type domain-containing protein, partial [Nephila pilipes]